MTIQVGDILGGKYKLKRLRGKGGMGAVYEAEHVVLGKSFAIKLLHPHYAMLAEVFQRFQLEAQAAAAIGHRGIVDVYDIGQTDDGSPYLVMEYLRGESLAELLERQGRLDVNVAVEIVAQTLSALKAVHKKKILHRDLKPENIFLCQDEDENWSIKILDFGISKVTGPEAMHLTMTGSILGTAHFMSPEQARGAKDVDLRADIWAVGAILFRALTGHLPFEGDSYNEVLAKILSDPVVSAQTKHPEIPETLDLIVLHALAKDRDERYASAADFLEDLEEFRPERGKAPSPWNGPIPRHESVEDDDAIPVTMTPSGGASFKHEDSKPTAAFDVESMDGLGRPGSDQVPMASTPSPVVTSSSGAGYPSGNVIPETRMVSPEHVMDSTPSWESSPGRPDTFDAAVKMAPRFSPRSGLVIAVLGVVGVVVILGAGLIAWALLGGSDRADAAEPSDVAAARPDSTYSSAEQLDEGHSTAKLDERPTVDDETSTAAMASSESFVSDGEGDQGQLSADEETSAPEDPDELRDAEEDESDEGATSRSADSRSRSQIAGTLRTYHQRLRQCVALSSSAPSVVRVRVRIARSGVVSYEGADPSPPSNVSSCFATVLRGARVGNGQYEPTSHTIAIRSTHRGQSSASRRSQRPRSATTRSSQQRQPAKSRSSLWANPF